MSALTDKERRLLYRLAVGNASALRRSCGLQRSRSGGLGLLVWLGAILRRSATRRKGFYDLHRRERVAGSFDRTITLPIRIDPDQIKAEYRDGILALFIPRAESDRPRSIKIG